MPGGPKGRITDDQYRPGAWRLLAWLGVHTGALLLIIWGNDRWSRLRKARSPYS
jgi:hypothetical protein